MCGNFLAQLHEYLSHPWTVLVFQVLAESHPCCSCLLPSHSVTNQSSHSHLAHQSGSWHWRNQWDSWREEYSPALSVSILRYLTLRQEQNSKEGYFEFNLLSLFLYFKQDLVVIGTDVVPNFHLNSNLKQSNGCAMSCNGWTHIITHIINVCPFLCVWHCVCVCVCLYF